MARSSPFTRLFVHLIEDLITAVDEENLDLLVDLMPDVKRLVNMVLTDERFADELPKEFRERLNVVLVS